MLIWYVVSIPASLRDNGKMLYFRELGLGSVVQLP